MLFYSVIKYKYREVKSPRNPKPIDKLMWAVFSPDGYLQSRTLADTKKMSMEQITDYGETWENYKEVGFRLFRVKVKIIPNNL